MLICLVVTIDSVIKRLSWKEIVTGEQRSLNAKIRDEDVSVKVSPFKCVNISSSHVFPRNLNGILTLFERWHRITRFPQVQYPKVRGDNWRCQEREANHEPSVAEGEFGHYQSCKPDGLVMLRIEAKGVARRRSRATACGRIPRCTSSVSMSSMISSMSLKRQTFAEFMRQALNRVDSQFAGVVMI